MINFYGFLNLEKLRFAEEQDVTLLNQMEGQKEAVEKVLMPGKIFLMRVLNKPHPVLVLVLAILDEYVLVADKTEHQKIYSNIASYSKAFEESVYQIDKVLIASVSQVSQPREADLLRIFNRYKKTYKEMIGERSEYIKDVAAKKHYPSYKSKKDVPEEVYSNRSDLVLQNVDFTDNEYDEITEKGYYHLSTLMHRMQNTKTSEAQLFFKELYAHNKELIKDIDFMDYGFIDSEILSNLTFAKFILEKFLFVTFLNGNKHFTMLLELYRFYNTEPNQKELIKEYIKAFNLISKKTEHSTEEKAQIQQFILDKVDHYYIQLFD